MRIKNMLLVVSQVLWIAACGVSDYEIGDEKATLDPLTFTVERKSATVAKLTWTIPSRVENLTLAYQAGATAPANCQVGTVTNLSSPDDLTALSSALLLSTQYSFRLCGRSKSGEFFSSGLTASVTTFPTCDYSLQVGELDTGTVDSLSFTSTIDSVDSSTEFNAFVLQMAATGGRGSDGQFTICLDNAVEVMNNNATAGTGSTLSSLADVYIYSELGSTASFVNQRTTGTAPLDRSAFVLLEATNVHLENINFTTTGTSGRGIIGVSASSIAELNNSIISTQSPFGQGINLRDTSSADSIANVTITTSDTSNSSGAHGILVQGNARIDAMKDVRITTAGNTGGATSNNAAYGLYMTSQTGTGSSVGSMESVVIETAGTDSHAIYLELGDCFIESMKDVQLRRSSNATTRGIGILFTGSTPYVQTANIQNVTFCSETGGTAWDFDNGKFIASSTGLPTTTLATAPTTHTARVTTETGIATFPFNGTSGAAGNEASIVFGGTCAD